MTWGNGASLESGAHYSGLQRGTPALHLNEPTWIIDGFIELKVDFLFALVIFLNSTQPRPFKSSKSNNGMSGKYNSKPRPASQQLPSAGSFKCRAGVPLVCSLSSSFVISR